MHSGNILEISSYVRTLGVLLPLRKLVGWLFSLSHHWRVVSSITVHPFVKAEFAPSILVIGSSKRITPLKANMEPEKKTLKKDFPVGHHYFQLLSFEVFPKFASKPLVKCQLDRYHIHDLQGSNQLPGGVFFVWKMASGFASAWGTYWDA